MGIKERFDKFSNKGFYSRVDTEHILELLIGLDENGHKAMKLRGQFKPKQIKGTESIEVKQYVGEKYSTIVFSLADDEVSNMFYLFCDDVIEASRVLPDANDGYQAVTNRFFLWKRLFGGRKLRLLTEPEIMGLIGELHLLSHDLFDLYGVHKALEGWSGQELTHKDFSYEGIWYESKAVLKSSLTVKISSIEQLQSAATGELDVVRLEKMSPVFNGLSLNKLIKAIYDAIEDDEDKESLMNKVAIQGFSFNDYYDQFNYALCESKKYKVDSHFPKLTKEEISPAILKAQYELDIKSLQIYEIK